MKITIKKIATKLLIVPFIALSFGLMFSPIANAATSTGCNPEDGIGGAIGSDCVQGADQPTDLFGSEGVVTTIINVMLFIVGILAVIMLIYGGIRYVVSGGDQGQVTTAKNTIMYAIVGLVVAILGYALVNFVVNQFKDN